MTTPREQVLADLAAESEQLDALLTGLEHGQWRAPTPAEGWTVAHQVAHLAWTDEVAVTAATDADGWDRLVVAAIEDPEHLVDKAAARGAREDPASLLARWREAREALAGVLRERSEPMPWFGPAMSPTSMATARLMETFAHGLDVAEALGATPEPTDRLRHVAHIGVRTRDFAFAANGLDPPAEEFRVELTAPSGEQWAWGPEQAAQRVTGPAWDFAVLVTQRRHRADLALECAGADADTWLDIAQAFAGPPGGGRRVQHPDQDRV